MSREPEKIMRIKPRTCDYCRESAAFYSATKGGAWAWMCPQHFKSRASDEGHKSGYKLEIVK